MDVRILSDCRGGDQHFTAGNVYSLPEELAKTLIALQRAEIAPPPVTETLDVELPLQPMKRGRKISKPESDED